MIFHDPLKPKNYFFYFQLLFTTILFHCYEVGSLNCWEIKSSFENAIHFHSIPPKELTRTLHILTHGGRTDTETQTQHRVKPCKNHKELSEREPLQTLISAYILPRDKTVYTFLFKILFQHLHILLVSEIVPTWSFK